MMRVQRFSAIGNSSAIASPSTSSQSVALNQPSDGASGNAVTDCMVINDTDKIGFVTFGKGSATATTSKIPVRAGQMIILDKGLADYAAVIMSGAPTSGGFYFQPGMGS